MQAYSFKSLPEDLQNMIKSQIRKMPLLQHQLLFDFVRDYIIYGVDSVKLTYNEWAQKLCENGVWNDEISLRLMPNALGEE